MGEEFTYKQTCAKLRATEKKYKIDGDRMCPEPAPAARPFVADYERAYISQPPRRRFTATLPLPYVKNLSPVHQLDVKVQSVERPSADHKGGEVQY